MFYRLVVLACVSTALLSARAGAAPVTIELQDVPDELALPSASNQNRMITAVVRGAAPAEVWLARAAGDAHRVSVPAIGEGRYQLNLVDDRVVSAMRRTGGSGQCYVFAKTADGHVAQSAAIRFGAAAPSAAFMVIMKDAGSNGGSTARPLAGDPFLQAERVEQFVASVDPPATDLKVTLAAGDRTWPMPTADGRTFTLAPTPEILAAWQQSGAVRVSADSTLYATNAATARALPRRIDAPVPDEGVLLNVRRGEGTPVPGTNGFLYFRLTNVDSAGNAADVTLHRRDENLSPVDPMLNEVSVFHLADEQYAWVLTAINPDARPEHTSVDVRVFAGRAAEAKVLQRLIDYTFAHDGRRVLKFNGKDYAGAEGSAQLRRLYETATDGGTLAAFGRALATREQEVKSEARVAGSASYAGVPLLDWLRTNLRKAGWEPLPDGAGPAARGPAGTAPQS